MNMNNCLAGGLVCYRARVYLVQPLEHDRELLPLCVVCGLSRECERVMQPVVE